MPRAPAAEVCLRCFCRRRTMSSLRQRPRLIAQPVRVSKEVRYARDDDVRLEEEGSTNVEGRLVVEEVLPPAARDDLRNDDGDELARRDHSQVLNILGKGTEHRAV